MSETEKLKQIALNNVLEYSERMKAIDTLGKLQNKEAMLALLDVAKDGMTYSERMNAQDKVTRILDKLRDEGKI